MAPTQLQRGHNSKTICVSPVWVHQCLKERSTLTCAPLWPFLTDGGACEGTGVATGACVGTRVVTRACEGTGLGTGLTPGAPQDWLGSVEAQL